ncbi:MAG: hypothetical protein M3Y72_10120, partial [Acidobacteriota bacterium]|nr:hypothetical protein [Acidobacteriota bacterium]
SKQDFSILASQAVEAVRTGRLEARLAAASLYFHGEFLNRDGDKADAIGEWKRAIELAPGSRAARDSNAELKKFG